jgi:hypothetical protein
MSGTRLNGQLVSTSAPRFPRKIDRELTLQCVCYKSAYCFGYDIFVAAVTNATLQKRYRFCNKLFYAQNKKCNKNYIL